MDMVQINQLVGELDSFVWGPVMLCLLVGTGVYMTLKLRFLTWRNLPYALKTIFSKKSRTTQVGSGDVSPFSALMTALAATIGTGNIVGVATAMFAGGPGALVWMWISACFGLTTKFSECMLGFKFREVNAKGEMKGGPMFTMKNGFKNKKAGLFLGTAFALFAVLASFGIGNMTQANSISTAINTTFGVSNEIVGAVLTVMTLAVIVGGITSISKVSSVVVPGMAVFYILAGLSCIILNIENIPHGLYLIVMMAFDPTAVEGGVVGTITVSVMNAMRYGVARGCFSNEAGLGSAAISAAASTTDHPARQGYISMTGTFIDTIIICTLTGLSIVVSGEWMNGLNGAALTNAAFKDAFPVFGGYMLMIGLVLFAFTTILGWNYYGERCMIYLCGTKGVLPYRIIFIILVASGAFLKLEAIWVLADIVNGLMAIPNLIALLALSGVVVRETAKYFDHLKTGKAYEEYEDLDPSKVTMSKAQESLED
jgi:amino acid carrier protein